jgi:hypothetical protein
MIHVFTIQNFFNIYKSYLTIINGTLQNNDQITKYQIYCVCIY